MTAASTDAELTGNHSYISLLQLKILNAFDRKILNTASVVRSGRAFGPPLARKLSTFQSQFLSKIRY
jgi:hypothetical protein